MPINEKKMQIVMNNYFNSECDINTSIREAFEKGFRIGVQKGYEIRRKPKERTAKVYQKQAPDRLYYFYCGFCGEMIDCSFYEDYKSIKSYCGYCGAKLDWSGDE